MLQVSHNDGSSTLFTSNGTREYGLQPQCIASRGCVARYSAQKFALPYERLASGETKSASVDVVMVVEFGFAVD